MEQFTLQLAKSVDPPQDLPDDALEQLRERLKALLPEGFNLPGWDSAGEIRLDAPDLEQILDPAKRTERVRQIEQLVNDACVGSGLRFEWFDVPQLPVAWSD